MNGLTKLRDVLLQGDNEIEVGADIAAAARRPIARLLEFAAARKQEVLGNNDA